MHHLLIYVCDGLDGLDLTTEQGACHTLDQRIRRCVGGILIGAWAVGGEVNTVNVLSEHTVGITLHVQYVKMQLGMCLTRQ